MRTRGPLEVARRRWRWLAAALLAGVLGGLASHLLATPSYRAGADVFFSLQAGDSAAELVQGSTYTRNQVESFARLATTPAVLAPVVDDLGLDTTVSALATQVSAVTPLDTVIVEVTVTDPDPERSARIANAVAGSLSTVVEGLSPEDASGRSTVQATTVAPADVPTAPSAPVLAVHLGVGVLVGLLAGAALAAVREATDTRVRDAEVLAEVTPLPVVGSIGVLALPGRERPVVVEVDPHGAAAESFRQLRTQLRFLGLPREAGGQTSAVQVLAVTSSLPAEGKSTLAANIAAALAETGARVLLVDADLRRPTVADVLGVEGDAGLTTVLVGDAELADVVQDWGGSGLQVLTAGPLPANPTELLGSPAMAAFLEQVRADYDHVVLDTAPVLPVADAAVLSRVVDGTLVVCNVSRVRRPQLAEALQTLERVGGRTLGVVLNHVRRDVEVYDYRRRDDGASGPVETGAGPVVSTSRRPAALTGAFALVRRAASGGPAGGRPTVTVRPAAGAPSGGSR